MIVTVVGARPQFVKAAVVSRALRNAGVVERIVHTGQHYDDRMSDVFWRELDLPGIATNLEIGSGPHGAQTGQMMERLERYLLDDARDARAMLVFGDTNSTLAGALVAAKLQLPVFHVEAGLRSHDRAMPEEINRVTTDHLSALLFCPSDASRRELAREGITEGVEVVGDVMKDAFMTFRSAGQNHRCGPSWGHQGRRRALLTVHRPSNTDDPARLAALLIELGKAAVDVLWPVHPRLRERLKQLDLPSNVTATEPLSYLEMLAALEAADVVVTDSGGLQKEAYWAHRPCITLRPETEWTETVESGWNTLAGDRLTELPDAMMAPPPTAHPELYGDGRASVRVAEAIRRALA